MRSRCVGCHGKSKHIWWTTNDWMASRFTLESRQRRAVMVEKQCEHERGRERARWGMRGVRVRNRHQAPWGPEQPYRLLERLEHWAWLFLACPSSVWPPRGSCSLSEFPSGTDLRAPGSKLKYELQEGRMREREKRGVWDVFGGVQMVVANDSEHGFKVCTLKTKRHQPSRNSISLCTKMHTH